MLIIRKIKESRIQHFWSLRYIDIHKQLFQKKKKLNLETRWEMQSHGIYNTRNEWHKIVSETYMMLISQSLESYFRVLQDRERKKENLKFLAAFLLRATTVCVFRRVEWVSSARFWHSNLLFWLTFSAYGPLQKEVDWAYHYIIDFLLTPMYFCRLTYYSHAYVFPILSFCYLSKGCYKMIIFWKMTSAN
jgi:hypothetical protein